MSNPPKLPSSTSRPSRSKSEADVGRLVSGKYRIEQLIARGGMAAVYLADHIQLHRPVALKILSPPADADDPAAFEQRFQLEAKTLAQMSHPNIVTLHDYGETEDGRFYLAMEYVGGPRLSELMRSSQLTVQRSISLMLQVCKAVTYAHNRGIVHRDLKPSNLLIRIDDENQEQIKVVDFGLVKLTTSDQAITRAGLILGSPHCMAPEQVKGHPVDERTDIYAIGVLLFRAVTGQYPFHGSNPSATMIAHLSENVPGLHEVAPNLRIPDGFETIIRTCLAKRPDDRFDNIGQVVEALKRCQCFDPEEFDTVTDHQLTLQNSLVTAQTRRRSLLLMATMSVLGLGAVLLLVAGLTGLLVGQSGLFSASQPTDPTTIEERLLKTPLDPESVDAPETIQQPDLTDPNIKNAILEKDPSSGQPEPAKTRSLTRSKRRQDAKKVGEKANKQEDTIEVAPGTASTNESTDSAKEGDANPVESTTTENKETDDTPEGYMGMPDF